MGRAARVVATVTLVAIGGAAITAGLIFAPSDRPTASARVTETVSKGVVRKSVSDTGAVADHYTYSIRPETDPVLLAVHGKEVESSGSTGSTGTGSTSTESTETYTLDELKVAAGDRVEKDDTLAVVLDADDNEIKVKAPFDGTVRSVSSAKKSSITEVATLGVGRSEVVVDVSQYDVVRLTKDQNVELNLDTDRTRFDGTVAEIAQQSTSTEDGDGMQTYQVVIRTSDLPKRARVGMTVSIKITLSSRDGVLSVPLTAVTESGGDSTVQVLQADGSVITRSVRLGLVGDTRVEITKGLRAGEEVVLGTINPNAGSSIGFGGGPGDDDDVPGAPPATNGGNQ